jgi:hypothetical protein
LSIKTVEQYIVVNCKGNATQHIIYF